VDVASECDVKWVYLYSKAAF